MSIGKSLRFKVFARDGFTCQYCGKRPPEVVLEVDHIHPRSKGGSDDSINLITACYDCNRGKSAKIISEVAPRPDADIEFLRVQQEIAEVERFLRAKEYRDEANRRLCFALQESWAEKLTDSVPSERVLLPWIKRYGPDEIEASIFAAIQAHQRGDFGWNEDAAFYKLVKYVGAVLRNREERGEAQ